MSKRTYTVSKALRGTERKLAEHAAEVLNERQLAARRPMRMGIEQYGPFRPVTYAEAFKLYRNGQDMFLVTIHHSDVRREADYGRVGYGVVNRLGYFASTKPMPYGLMFSAVWGKGALNIKRLKEG